MPCRCGSRQKDTDVFARLSSRHHAAAPDLGDCVPGRPLRAPFLLQLLVIIAGADDCSFLVAGQLPRIVPGKRLPANIISLYVDRGPSHGLFSAAWVAAGILPFFPGRQEKRPVLSISDHSTLCELPGPGLRMEDDPWQRWRT